MGAKFTIDTIGMMMNNLETVLMKAHLGRFQANEMLKDLRVGEPLGPDLTRDEVKELLASNIEIFDKLIETLDRYATANGGEPSTLEQAIEQAEREYGSADLPLQSDMVTDKVHTTPNLAIVGK